MSEVVYLNALGLINPLGVAKADISKGLFAGSQSGMVSRTDLLKDKSVIVGEVSSNLPQIPERLKHNDSRNNRLMLAALLQIEGEITEAIETFGADRVGVVLGTSTSGIGDNEVAIAQKVETGKFPENYQFLRQETASVSEFTASYFDLTGVSMTISTACTSSAKAIASGRRYIQAGICDAVIVGGADSLCRLTVNGFDSLESLSKGICKPFANDRDGINIGEGAVAFLMTKEEGSVEIAGVGETSDAHHISAPDPMGTGAIAAMRAALVDAECEATDINYLNLHGTATTLNDAMEAKAVSEVFENTVLCSSTKNMTGHMLGAAGASEAAFLWLAIENSILPPQIWAMGSKTDFKNLNFSKGVCSHNSKRTLMMSNSFAFGGNNISLILRGNAQC